MRIVSSADLGMPSAVSGDALVDASPAALADMQAQDQPVRFQGQETYKDQSGAMRYKVTPGFKVMSSADIGIQPTPLPKQNFEWSTEDVVESLKRVFTEVFTSKTPGAEPKPHDDQYPEDSYGEQKVNQDDLTKPSFVRPFAGARRTNSGANEDVGTIPALLDMFAGLPGQTLNAATYWNARAMFSAEHAPSEHGAKMARDLADTMVPDVFTTPFRKIMGSLGYADKYDNSTVSKAMNIVNKSIEEGGSGLTEMTGGVVQPEDIQALAQTVMSVAGVKGGEAAFKKALILKEQLRKATAAEPVVPEEHIDPTLTEQNVTSGEQPQPVVKPNIKLKSTPEQIGQITEDVKQQTQAEPELGTVEHIKKYIDDHPELKGDIALGAAAVAAGGWLYMNPEDAEKVGLTGLAMAGAIKSKGGMWHPEAVTKLAEPLKNKLVSAVPGGIAARAAIIRERFGREATIDELTNKDDGGIASQWADKSIKNWLNKHAGTETDPLKDIMVPMMGDDVRWENLTDQMIGDMKAGDALAKESGARVGETVWDVNRYNRDHPETNAITSYLSHVGDYLREFVPSAPLEPDAWIAQKAPRDVSNVTELEQLYQKYKSDNPLGELGKFDLVRAVKETAKQDEIQAAKMAKARVNQEGIVDHKVYPDGMKWVEVGVPAKEGLPPGYRVEEFSDKHWQVRDAKNELLEINDTDKAGNYLRSVWKSPVEAEIAARRHAADEALKNEGDVMGHCVGGYCEYVHSGESKIYSLRDQKGMSHVTIEVQPEGKGFLGGGSGGIEDPANINPNILQIKGKQNRAPVEKYLPYVQDFVRSGKWGDVGDLENAGLVQLKHLSPAEATIAGDMFPGEQFLTKEQAKELYKPVEQALKEGVPSHKVPERVREILRQQREQGSIDPKLLARMAAVGIGAAVGVVLDPNNPISAAIKGAVGGAIIGHISPRGAVNSIKNALKPGQMVKIDQLRNYTEYNRKAATRTLFQIQSKVEELAPEPGQQVILTRALRGVPAKLSTKEQQAVGVARQFFNDMWKYANDQGVIKDFEQNYVTQLWGQPGKTLLQQLQSGGGSGTSAKTPYSIKRTLTFDEGIAAGLKPLTEDLSTIMGIYGNSVIKAVENSKFINTLKNVREPGGGNKLLMKNSASVPKDYVSIDHPQLQGLRIHPDIAPDLKFIFDANDPNIIVRGLEALNTTQKRMAVSLSLFHAKALEDAMMGASVIMKSPGRFVKSLAQASLPRVFGENTFIKQIRTGGAGDLVDMSLKDGLEWSYQKRAPVIEEVNKGFYEAMSGAQKLLDNSVPGLGKATIGTYTAVNHAFDNFMWGRLHAALKLEIYAEKRAEMIKNNALAHAKDPVKYPSVSDGDLGKQAASFTNDTFGGLNWQRLAMEPSTRWGREIASALFGPSGRRAMRLGLFAPDWTISTTRAFVKAFNLGNGSGPMGLLSPKTITDLHRQYIIRSAFWYFTIGDSINYVMTGHHVWDNKDKTRLELGDGRTMQWSKHSMEPIHWMTMPGQQALNKLGVIPKEILTQALHKEYLSTKFMPEMKDSRIGHLLKNYRPIGVGQAMEGDDVSQSIGPAIASTLGAPIYGRTNEQKERMKAANKLKAAETRARRALEKR